MPPSSGSGRRNSRGNSPPCSNVSRHFANGCSTISIHGFPSSRLATSVIRIIRAEKTTAHDLDLFPGVNAGHFQVGYASLEALRLARVSDAWCARGAFVLTGTECD